MLGVERQQATERGALSLDGPNHAGVARHALGDPLPQQLLDLSFELVGVGEALVRAQILTIGRLKPAHEKGIKVLLLGPF